jgi:hypothetical protein
MLYVLHITHIVFFSEKIFFARQNIIYSKPNWHFCKSINKKYFFQDKNSFFLRFFLLSFYQRLKIRIGLYIFIE